jgi:hypothetical protein
MKRSRGRGRRQQNSVNRSYDSNGPDVRVRGNASQVYEKYQTLARDAMSSGDRVMAENYQQHAEHYYRILMSMPIPMLAPMAWQMEIRMRQKPMPLASLWFWCARRQRMARVMANHRNRRAAVGPCVKNAPKVVSPTLPKPMEAWCKPMEVSKRLRLSPSPHQTVL